MSGERPGFSLRRGKKNSIAASAMLLAILLAVPAGTGGFGAGADGCGGRTSGLSAPEPPVVWVQDSPEDFNGSADNPGLPADVVIDGAGISIEDDLFQLVQTDWSGGPNVAQQLPGGNGFYSSKGIKWANAGNLSLLREPVWALKAPLSMERDTLKAVWDDNNSQVIIFGGFAWIGGTRTLLNHTEYYNPSTDSWSKGASTPPGRQSPAAAWDSKRDQMFIFGGNDGSTAQYSDAWMFSPGNGSGGCWTRVSSCPQAMQNGNAIYDPATDLLVAHGRSNMQVSRYNPAADAWFEGDEGFHIRDYAGGAWLPDQSLFMIVNGDDYANKPETAFYAPATDTWVAGPDYPPDRWYPTLVWDDFQKVAILYGGTTGGGFAGATDEIWLYDPRDGNWTLLDDRSGPKVYAHAAVWDPVDRQMLVMGGITSANALSSSVYSMRLGYCSTSLLESSTFDTGGIASIKGVDWEMEDIPQGVGRDCVKLQLATSQSLTPSKFVGPDGTSGSYYNDSGPAESTVHAGDRLLRYRLTMSTGDTNATPVLGRISINCTRYRSTGSLTSPVFDAGLASLKGVRVDWQADTPSGTSIDVYVRSSADAGMASAGGWTKVDNGQNLSGMDLKRYVQYRAELGSTSHCATPRLWSISFGFNGAPSLAVAGHVPPLGNLSTVFTFYVTYADPDGMAPACATIVLDGRSVPMSPLSGGNARDGLHYECATVLARGSHLYYFLFNDGFGDVRLPASGSLQGPVVNADPVLGQGEVDPPEGNTSTVFNFTVRYSDPERAAATIASLVIDGTLNLTMATRAAGAQDFYVYERNATLPAGNHGYSFRFSDGLTEVRLPPVGEFPGPLVRQPPEAPGILEVFPPEGARDVPVNASVEATFDHPLDVASLSTSTFSIRNSRGQPVSGSISLEMADTRVIFRPAANLSWNETYTARMTTGVRDLNGTALGTDHNWSFTTVGRPPVAPVNHPPEVLPRFERTVTEGQELVLDLNATDPDGDALHYRVRSGPNSTQVNDSGILSWKTWRGSRGVYDIVVEVSDGNLTNLTTVRVTVEKAPGGGGEGGTDYLFLAGIVILVAATAVLVAAIVMRRRRGGTAPGGLGAETGPPAVAPSEYGRPPGQA